MASGELDAGGLLRQARRGAGLSQVDLANRTGVTQSVISAHESGHRQPSLPTLAALVEAADYELVAEIRPRLQAELESILGARVDLVPSRDLKPDDGPRAEAVWWSCELSRPRAAAGPTGDARP
jgi:transcriptional regulator with XRE-family HTH domain